MADAVEDGRAGRAVRLALPPCLVLLQIVAFLVASGDPSWRHAYRALCYWDSRHYARIVEVGYVSGWPPTDPGSTVGFFPGYPLLATGVQRLFHVDTTLALLWTSQLAAVVFWGYVLAFARRLKLSPMVTFLVVWVIAGFPSGFYLVAGYSESVFLASLLGFVFWLTGEHPWGFVVAGLHGMLMTSTRLFGLPAAVLPCVVAAAILWTRQRGASRPAARPVVARAATASVLALAGVALFFLYCQAAFGHWDIYFWRQKLGWHVTSDPWAPLEWRSYTLCLENDWRDSNCLSRSFTGLVSYGLVGVAVGVAASARRISRGVASLREEAFDLRVGAFAGAVLLLEVGIAASAPRAMMGMIRYAFPSCVLGVVAVLPSLRKPSDLQLRLLVALAVVLSVVETLMMSRFSARIWVS